MRKFQVYQKRVCHFKRELYRFCSLIVSGVCYVLHPVIKSTLLLLLRLQPFIFFSGL